MTVNVIGISALFHDAACCLLQDGRLVAAAEEERFTRVKHDASIPLHAFRYCLEQGGLTISDIDCVAYYEEPTKKLERQLWAELPEVPTRRREALFRLDATKPATGLREILGYEGRVECVAHHMSHAASSYYFSGFPDAAVLTTDGVGEWTTTSYGRARGKDLSLFEEVLFPHSLGLLYSAITAYLGFEVFEGEYKVMGLAPYGAPVHRDAIYELIENDDGGQYRLRMKYFDFLNTDRMFSDALCSLFGRPPREPEAELCSFTKDVARSLQEVLEEILLQKVRYLHRQVPSKNLCLAGGVALNCVANGRILREGPFERLFVQPASSDAGGCLGAAAVGHLRVTGEAPAEPLRHVYLGPAWSGEEVARLLSSAPPRAVDQPRSSEALVEAAVDRLAAGKVLGWFQGRMEFGPRSLGARSILADPREPDMRDRINALVKKREGFRPFAPAVLATRATDHFDLDHESPFMLETCQVRSRLDLPAITHVDGSARVQTVTPDTNPRFAALLDAFERRTGCPILLNTSFNVRGEPIVCTPTEALLCFIRSDIDCLVLEDSLIDRDRLPAQWVRWFHDTVAEQVSRKHTVYTFL